MILHEYGLGKSSRANSAGFTIVELVVVIAIMGILSAIVTSRIDIARAGGRDDRRVADIALIRQGLARFREFNGYYPTTLYPTVSYPTDDTGKRQDMRTFLPGRTIPLDPGRNTGRYFYSRNATSPAGRYYVLAACLEVTTESLTDAQGSLRNDADVSNTGNYSYLSCNPSARDPLQNCSFPNLLWNNTALCPTSNLYDVTN